VVNINVQAFHDGISGILERLEPRLALRCSVYMYLGKSDGRFEHMGSTYALWTSVEVHVPP
jgi:hypothetical protein